MAIPAHLLLVDDLHFLAVPLVLGVDLLAGLVQDLVQVDELVRRQFEPALHLVRVQAAPFFGSWPGRPGRQYRRWRGEASRKRAYYDSTGKNQYQVDRDDKVGALHRVDPSLMLFGVQQIDAEARD